MPFIFPEDDEEGNYKTHRFTLQCKVSDVNYIPLLKAISNQDLGIQPSIIHRIYFLNIKRKTIFTFTMIEDVIYSLPRLINTRHLFYIQ